MSFANIVNVLRSRGEGKLRALAITSIKRSVLAPDLPTMANPASPASSRAVVRPARAYRHAEGCFG